MLNNFCVFEGLVFFGLWIPDSGFRIPVSWFNLLNNCGIVRVSAVCQGKTKYACIHDVPD